MVLGVAHSDVGSIRPYQHQQPPQESQYTTEPIPIIRQEQVINPDGSYKWRLVLK